MLKICNLPLTAQRGYSKGFGPWPWFLVRFQGIEGHKVHDVPLEKQDNPTYSLSWADKLHSSDSFREAKVSWVSLASCFHAVIEVIELRSWGPPGGVL